MKEIGPFSERQSSRRHTSWVVEAGGKIRGVPHYQSQEDEQEQKTVTSSAAALPEEVCC